MLLALPFILAAQPVQAQVFNSARSLPAGAVALIGAPVVFNEGDINDIALFAIGRYGVGNGLDLEARAGFFENDTYVGGSVELGLRGAPPYIAMMTGVHVMGDLGFDGGLNIAYPLSPTFDLYGGLDFDLIFDEDPDLPSWANLGIDVTFVEQIHFMAEFNIGINEISPNIWGAAFVFHF